MPATHSTRDRLQQRHEKTEGVRGSLTKSFDEADAPTIEELTSLCADHLVKYKAPRSFELVRALPRNEAGKIRRSQLREERGG